DAGLARMARAAGMDYAGLVSTVCELALARHALPASEGWTVAQRLSGVAPIADATALELFSSSR
ncbi:MAG TPA: hypothetical protein VIQ60_14205, partial [Gemmatimonadaceae bacterium]